MNSKIKLLFYASSAVLILAAVLAIGEYLSFLNGQEPGAPSADLPTERGSDLRPLAGNGLPEKLSSPLMVVKVFDGDTIELANGERVRYLGLDAAEVGEPCYEEAKRRNEELVLNKLIRLEYDAELKDKYGRTLAYVWVGNIMVNFKLVREGYAKELNFPPNMRYAEEFESAEQEAKQLNLGCWGL